MTTEDKGSDRDKLREQMAALARFGDHAFRTDDLQALLEDAAALAAAGTGAGRAALLELTPGGRLIVRAGAGWDPDVIGRLVPDGDRRSPAGYALLVGEPVVSEDLEQETRFAIPQILRGQGIRSVVDVVVNGAEAPFGVLAVHSPDHRRFTRDDVNFLQGHAGLLAAAIHRLHAEEERQAAAKARTLLLRELQHRLKNNLQLITSIVRIQKTSVQTPDARRHFDSLINRLMALSLVHKQLHAPDAPQALALDNYIEELCSNLVTTANLESEDIKLDLGLQPIAVTPDLASSIGLVVNEFVTNSIRHAFPERRGTIRITLAPAGRAPSAPGSAGAEQIRLSLSDDGTGIRAPAARRGGLGLQLIDSLVKQIGGSIEWGHGRGTRATIVFPN